MSAEEGVSAVDEKGNFDAPSESSVVHYSPEDEKKLLRKLDSNLLPAVILLYLLSFLDRSNGALNRSLFLDNMLHENAYGAMALQWPTRELKGWQLTSILRVINTSQV